MNTSTEADRWTWFMVVFAFLLLWLATRADAVWVVIGKILSGG